MHLTDDFLFQQEFMLSVSYAYLQFDYPFVLLYICSLGFLSSAAFLFLRQVLGWKLGLGEECIGALVDYPMIRSPFALDLEDDELVKIVYDESANLFNNPHTSETSYFTVAAG